METAPIQPTRATSSTNGTQVVVVDRSTKGMTAAVPWCDLPGDLLGIVNAMVPTTLDRVRLAAVCVPWRAALASRRLYPLPPALPWLLFSPRRVEGVRTERLLYSPEDSWPVMRVSLRSIATGSRILGSYTGGWVATFEEGRRILAIVNLFSGAEVTLSRKQSRLIVHEPRGINYSFHAQKLVFSEAPTSSGCILAAINNYSHVAVCRIGCAKGGWKMAPFREIEHVLDIAFCNGGELYGLLVEGSHDTEGTEGLIRYKVSVDDEGAPVVTSARRLFVERRHGPGFVVDRWAYVSYILELHGKPAMAVRERWSRDHEPSFRVFELDRNPDACRTYTWEEVMSLGDYALFVGPTASYKVAHISNGRRGQVEANRVYYFNHIFLFEDDEPLDGDAVCMDVNGGRALYSGGESDDSDSPKRRITSVGYYVVDPRTTTWLLPPDIEQAN